MNRRSSFLKDRIASPLGVLLCGTLLSLLLMSFGSQLWPARVVWPRVFETWGDVGICAFVVIISMLSSVWTLSAYLLYRRQRDYQGIAIQLHQINATYRNFIASLFYEESDSVSERATEENTNALLGEQRCLNEVCRKIANVFTYLTGKVCTVSVFLRDEDGDDVLYFLWEICCFVVYW